MEFPRQEYRSGLSFPSPGHLLDQGIEPAPPASAGKFFTTKYLHIYITSTTYIYVCVCVCVCVWSYIYMWSPLSYIYKYLYISHLFYQFICWWCLGCFHAFDLVYSVPMNIGMSVSFWIIVLSGYTVRSGITGSYINSSFNFLRNLYTVFHNDCSTCIPTNSVRGFPLLHSLSNTYYL